MTLASWLVENAMAAKLTWIALFRRPSNYYTVIGSSVMGSRRKLDISGPGQGTVGERTSFATQGRGRSRRGRSRTDIGSRDATFLAYPPSAALLFSTLPHTLPVLSPANFQDSKKSLSDGHRHECRVNLDCRTASSRDRELNESLSVSPSTRLSRDCRRQRMAREPAISTPIWITNAYCGYRSGGMVQTTGVLRGQSLYRSKISKG